MADTVPGDVVTTTLYKVIQKLPNGGITCKVFQPEGLNIAMADLLAGVAGSSKTVEVSSLALNTKAVNLADFFSAGGMLFSTSDIK